MTDLAKLEASPETTIDVRRRGEAITTATPAEAVVEYLMTLANFKSLLRQIEQENEPRVMEWIEANGDLECGDLRWYVGTDKVKKPTSAGNVLESLLIHEQGDYKLVAERYFSSDALKPGAIREALGDEKFAELFTVTEKQDLKTGKAKRGLKQANKNFLR